MAAGYCVPSNFRAGENRGSSRVMAAISRSSCCTGSLISLRKLNDIRLGSTLPASGIIYRNGPAVDEVSVVPLADNTTLSALMAGFHVEGIISDNPSGAESNAVGDPTVASGS